MNKSVENQSSNNFKTLDQWYLDFYVYSIF